MATEESDKVVGITMKDGLPVPAEDPVPVMKNLQKLRWEAAFEFRITIDGYTNIKYSGGNGSPYVCKTGTFDQQKQYKYTISANGVDNDPMIDVRPAP